LSSKELVQAGKIVGIHGIRGEIKVLSYGNYENGAWKALHIQSEEGIAEHEVLWSRPHKRVILVKLADINSREEAATLISCEVFLKRSFFKKLPEGEYYRFEIEGMEVETDDGRYLGSITDILSTGSNDVYVVDGPIGEILIPAIKDVVLKVDVKQKKMLVHLIEGLL
jgi:16S rRNA processing protein RimM